MSPMTLRSLEHGGNGVTIGAYLTVMQVLGVEQDLNLLAKADPLGRELQDARISGSKKAPRAGRISSAKPTRKMRSLEKVLESAEASPDWIANSGFKTATELSELINPPKPISKKER